MIMKRLDALREEMKKRMLAAYIIPTADYHQSEYVGEHFLARQYMSGFTGSAGVLVVTKEKAGLWTDGRYFIQASNQLKDSTITLFRQGEEGVLTIEEFLLEEVEENATVGFDGRVMSAAWGESLERKLTAKQITISYQEDLVSLCWEDRPELSSEKAFLLDTKYAGESAKEKIARIREKMKEQKATYHIVTSLDDVAWILNIRGNDISYNPVILSYLIITTKDVFYFIEESKLTEEVRLALEQLGCSVRPYNDIYAFVTTISSGEVVLYDKDRVNYTIAKNLPEGVSVVSSINPSTLMKAIKNEVELANLRKCHIKDGVAFTKFMYWLKKNIGKQRITELTASDYLEKMRKEQEGFISLSFDTICAYKENAAMMHYSATETSHKELEKAGLLLVDSGGQYFEGTTDITRTIALGPVCEEQRRHFTAVVNAMLNLANAKFLYGCTGQNLDILARGPIWNMDIDYKCGTGHGVGYLLNVHEAPNGFRWKKVPERNDSAVLEAGMVTTDEPGVYIEGSHGIRIENELICAKGEKNEYGQFMNFEQITMAPIDLDALDMTLMTSVEKARLNEYHKRVYETLLPYLSIEEALWLKEYTREI